MIGLQGWLSGLWLNVFSYNILICFGNLVGWTPFLFTLCFKETFCTQANIFHWKMHTNISFSNKRNKTDRWLEKFKNWLEISKSCSKFPTKLQAIRESCTNTFCTKIGKSYPILNCLEERFRCLGGAKSKLLTLQITGGIWYNRSSWAKSRHYWRWNLIFKTF